MLQPRTIFSQTARMLGVNTSGGALLSTICIFHGIFETDTDTYVHKCRFLCMAETRTRQTRGIFGGFSVDAAKLGKKVLISRLLSLIVLDLHARTTPIIHPLGTDLNWIWPWLQGDLHYSINPRQSIAYHDQNVHCICNSFDGHPLSQDRSRPSSSKQGMLGEKHQK